MIVASLVAYAELVIPADEIQPDQIYFGNAASFASPAEVDMIAIIRATPEFDEIKKKKIPKGTAKYWILRSNGTDRALRAIQQLAEDTDHDLFANEGYLGSLATPIECENLTKEAIDLVEE